MTDDVGKWREKIAKVVGTKPDDFTGDALRWIAAGPICDPLQAYCPAGRLTARELAARERSNVSIEGKP